MKKIFLLLLIAALAIGVSGCSEDEDTTPAGDDDDDDTGSGGDGTDESDFLLCDAEEPLTEDNAENSERCWVTCYGCAITAANEEEGTKEGACYEVYTACQEDAECLALSECVSPACDDEEDWLACYEACVAEHPDGQEKYGALDTCILCEGCTNACDFASTPEDCEE